MTKISALPAGTAATGAENIPAVQGLNTVKLTLAKVATTASASDLSSGTLPAAQLPNPTASTLGGVESIAASPHNWINSISTSGVPSLSQPAASDLSNGVTGSGSVVLSAGTLAITTGKTATVSNTLTFTGTDGSSVAFGTGGTVTYTANNLSVFAATTSAQLAGVISDETGSGALVFANTPTLVTPVLGVATATSVAASGAISSSSPSGGIGYASGSGSTVTQITSKATGVAINAVCGTITTINSALAAATIVSFLVTNTSVAATDVIILNHGSGGTPGSYTLNARAGVGSFTIDIRNNTAGSLSEAISMEFAVIKGANS